MPSIHRLHPKLDALLSAGVALLALLLGLWPALPAAAQSGSRVPGVFLEIEGQATFGESDFDGGVVPTLGPTPFEVAKLDDGDGWGGAFALGYAWGDGWSAAVRYRRIEMSENGGPVEPGLIPFGAGVPFIPGGFIVGVLEAYTEVESTASIVDIEVGRDFVFQGGFVHLYAGLTYADIERNTAIIDKCGCPQYAFLMDSDFRGAGPKIGFRGGIPLNGMISVVGGAAAAAQFGTSKFSSRVDDPLSPPFPFEAKDRRTVAAINAEAGLALAIGPGSLTVGYRVDALLGAMDTDQRVSEIFRAGGFPSLGDTRDDYVAHGPFARFSLPLAGVAE